MDNPVSTTRPRRVRRGTLRNPGADLRRLPIALDLSGISLAEGLRAALGTGTFIAINEWIGSVPLLIAATGAMITCFCDVGGSLRQRLPMLLSFTVLGALAWAAFGLLRNFELPIVVPVAGGATFLFSMARVWGLRAQTVGNILIVVMALALDKALAPDDAALFAAAFAVGGLWASFLTLVIWRIQSDRPAARAVGAVWTMLAALAADLRALLQQPATSVADWDAHALGHRRAVRGAIEDARTLVASSLRSRDLISGRGTQTLLLLEAAEQLFGEFIILSELLEAMGKSEDRAHAERILRRLRPILLLLGLDHLPATAKLRASLDQAAAEAETITPLRGIISVIVDRLRVTIRILEGAERPNLRDATVQPDVNLFQARVWGPLRDELTWRSATLRHAVRATALTTPAVAISLLWWTPYAHWLTITVALTMQPFFAATWQRALERIGGTMLGAAIGAALSFFPQTPLVTAVLLIPLSIIGFSVRQVSYGAYIACLTPLVVVVFDVAQPGHSGWATAGMRTFYTLVGGVVAVGACMVLWPSWEPNRLKRELRDTLLAYRRLALEALAAQGPERSGAIEAARRTAGLANSNLEASLARALQEPGRKVRAELDKVITADALLRRLGAAILAMPHDVSVATVLAGPERDLWRGWLDNAFTALAEGHAVAGEAPEAPTSSTLQRIRRGIEVLSQDLLTSGVLKQAKP